MLSYYHECEKSSNDDKFSEKKIAGEIKCLYKIIEISSVTQLLSKEFKKNSKMDILINGTRLNNFVYNYTFTKTGEYQVRFVFYDKIKMDKMFKDISNLISAEMISKKKLKIISMENAFEN